MKHNDANINAPSNLQVEANIKQRGECQLISETGDQSEDVGKEMKLQVPLKNMNDAIYQGIMYLGSPVS